jgi:Uma2 family endonuclease
MGLPAFQPPFDAPTRVSPEDYLRLEREAEYKHEYYAGEIRAMAGASFAHNKVCINLAIGLGGLLRGKGCTPIGSDQRVHVKNKASFLYPDLSVVCGQPEFMEDKKPDTLLNPVLIAEVLSASTKDKDRGEKFMLYRQIPSLRHYLLLSSESVHAELYSLDEQGRWVLTETRDPAAVLDLAALGCQLPLADVYEGVTLASDEPELPLD